MISSLKEITINLSHLMATWLNSTPFSLEIQNSLWPRLIGPLGMVLPFLPTVSQLFKDSHSVLSYWRGILLNKSLLNKPKKPVFHPMNGQLCTTTMGSTMAYHILHCPEATCLIDQWNVFFGSISETPAYRLYPVKTEYNPSGWRSS